MYTEDKVTFSDFFRLKQLKAETRLPGTFGEQNFKVSHFDTVDSYNPMIFFDDIKTIKFYYPKLSQGARTYLDYTYDVLEPRNLEEFYFSNNVPVENAKLTVSAPLEVELGFKMYNCSNLSIDFSRKVMTYKMIYTSTGKHIPALKTVENAPSVPYYAAHIIVYIKSYRIHGKLVKLLDNPGDLHKWYHELISTVKQEFHPELKNLVDSLTNPLSTDEQKVQKILFWVQDHIKYIAFEAGNGGYVPRESGESYF